MHKYLILLLLFSGSLLYSQSSHEKIDISLQPAKELSFIQSRNSAGVDLPYHPFLSNLTFVETQLAYERHANVKTYDVFKDHTFIGTFTWSEKAVWYYIYTDDGLLSIYPKDYMHSDVHTIEMGMEKSHLPICGVLGRCDRANRHIHKLREFSFFGEYYRTYRLALVVTHEFYTQNGNSDAAVNAVVMSTVQGLNALYKREASVSFNLIRWEKFGLNEPPFDNPNSETRVDVANEAIQSRFNADNYDLGHVLHKHPNQGDDWGSGGLAQINAACTTGKSGGWSGSYSNNGFGWISLIAHEVGHMFGANHTFNGSGGNGDACAAISNSTAYEIGSGTTIMSYNDLCDDNQNIPAGPNGIDNYFHIGSLVEMYNHITSLNTVCGEMIPSTNNLPVARANPCQAVYHLPKGTPFYLKGEVNDLDDDVLLYNWEQIDEDGPGTPTQGKIGSAAANDDRAPLFRSFPPNTSSERYFPSLSALNGGGSDFEVLSNVPRQIKLSFNVRDQHDQGGGISNDLATLDVVGNGPLEVNTMNDWEYGETVNIQWNTNGTNDICETVKIELSTDGGLSYPYKIADGIEYSAESFNHIVRGILPDTETAKIKISCDDYECFYFFNISNEFKIESSCYLADIVLCPAEDIVINGTDTDIEVQSEIRFGSIQNGISSTIDTNDPIQEINIWKYDESACESYTSSYIDELILSVTQDGDYTFDVNNTHTVLVTIYDREEQANGGCNGFIGSNSVRVENANTFYPRQIFTVTLEACKEYSIKVATVADPPYTYNINDIAGPGDVVMDNPPISDVYSYFIVLNSETQTISGIFTDNNFSNLSGGSYIVYGLVSEDEIVNDLIGQHFLELELNICSSTSKNSFSLIIEDNCNNYLDAPESFEGCLDEESIVEIYTDASLIKWYIDGQLDPIKEGPEKFIVVDSSVILNVEVGNSDDCILSANIIVEIRESINPTLPESILACIGQEVLLDANVDDGIIVWSKDDVIIFGADESKLTISESGVYKVSVFNGSCEGMAESIVNFTESPSVSLPEALPLCADKELVIEAIHGGETFVWYKDEVLLNKEDENYIVVDEPGTYKVISSFNGDCASEASVVVSQVDKPEINLDETIRACVGEQVMLSGPNGNYTYNWQLNNISIADTKDVIITEPGLYQLEVSNTNMCTAEDEVEVRYFDLPILTTDEEFINLCKGDTTYIILETDAVNITWIRNDEVITEEKGNQLQITRGGKYKALAETGEGCFSEVLIGVNEVELPMVDLGKDRVECESSEPLLTFEGNAIDVQWLFEDLLLSTDDSIVVVEEGSYTLIAKNEFGCIDSDIVEISFAPPPEIELISSLDLCEGEFKTVKATTNGNLYQWYKGDELLEGKILTTFLINSGGTYRFESSNGENCKTTKELVVTEYETPQVDLGEDIYLCPGESIQLTAGDNMDYDYNWSTGDQTPSLLIEHTLGGYNRTYIVTVTSEAGCEGRDTIHVEAEQKAIAQIDADQDYICLGDSLIIEGSGGEDIMWSSNDSTYIQINDEKIKVFPTQTSVYYLNVSSSCLENESTDSLIIEVRKSEELGVIPDTCVLEGKSIQLSGFGGVKYEWESDESILSDLDIETITVQPAKQNTYSVTITDINGCSLTESVTVCVIEDYEDIIEPITLITPNGDNFNDQLIFEDLELFTTNDLKIYNRWGVIVFEQVDYQLKGELFSGYAGPDQLPADTYYYILKYDDQLLKSTLTIIREKD